MERRSRFHSWLPLILQTVALLAAGWGYASTQEHRLTLIESDTRYNSQVLTQMATQMQDMQRIVTRMVALEEYVHGTAHKGVK